MEVYLVGGAVRDKLLELPVSERDWVVVGATPEQMLALGYRQVGKDFPVFLHPETGDEYALARTERKTGPGYKGFTFHASPDVTLEEDLLRRDLTVNAIAETVDGTLIDPYHGQDDLREGLLRHVSPAFAEDPVRVLRVARLAARFGKWGFKVAHGTNALMRKMVQNGEVDHLVAERVWAEFTKALATDTPQRFFEVLHGCGALGVLFPAIERAYAPGDPSHNKQLDNRGLEALARASERTEDPRVRFAALMRAVDAQSSQEQRMNTVRQLCERYKAPTEYQQLAELAIELESDCGAQNAETRLGVLERADAYRKPRRWQLLLETFLACDLLDRDQIQRWQADFERTRSVESEALRRQGFSGKALGTAIREKRLALLSDLDEKP